jgi:hypothetical protein
VIPAFSGRGWSAAGPAGPELEVDVSRPKILPVVQGDEPSGALSADTTRHAERLQVMAWRSMSSVQRAQLVAGAARTVRAIALAGLRQRHPGASEAEIVARLALLTLGPSLAHRAYLHLLDIPDASGD